MSKGFVLKRLGNMDFFEIPSFAETGLVIHGFSTRNGGVGKRPYDTLNLAFHVGDEKDIVITNRKILCNALGVSIENMVTAKQVHGVNIAVVYPEQAGAGAVDYESAIPDTDGLITNRAGLLLSTFYADCVPIYILDPVKRAVASVHAGWKGTIARIGAHALKIMAENYGTKPQDCLVGVGPSIGPCCYEIGEPVIEAVKSRFSWWAEVLNFESGDRVKFDLWKANRNIMIDAGIKQDNVELASMCTCCNQDVLFSYRGSSGITGRMGAFLMLR